MVEEIILPVLGSIFAPKAVAREAESVGTEDGRLQRHNVTQQSLNGAKLLLNTAANRVRQVVDEIEIVTQREQPE